MPPLSAEQQAREVNENKQREGHEALKSKLEETLLQLEKEKRDREKQQAVQQELTEKLTALTREQQQAAEQNRAMQAKHAAELASAQQRAQQHEADANAAKALLALQQEQAQRNEIQSVLREMQHHIEIETEKKDTEATLQAKLAAQLAEQSSENERKRVEEKEREDKAKAEREQQHKSQVEAMRLENEGLKKEVDQLKGEKGELQVELKDSNSEHDAMIDRTRIKIEKMQDAERRAEKHATDAESKEAEAAAANARADSETKRRETAEAQADKLEEKLQTAEERAEQERKELEARFKEKQRAIEAEWFEDMKKINQRLADSLKIKKEHEKKAGEAVERAAQHELAAGRQPRLHAHRQMAQLLFLLPAAPPMLPASERTKVLVIAIAGEGTGLGGYLQWSFPDSLMFAQMHGLGLNPVTLFRRTQCTLAELLIAVNEWKRDTGETRFCVYVTGHNNEEGLLHLRDTTAAERKSGKAKAEYFDFGKEILQWWLTKQHLDGAHLTAVNDACCSRQNAQAKELKLLNFLGQAASTEKTKARDNHLVPMLAELDVLKKPSHLSDKSKQAAETARLYVVDGEKEVTTRKDGCFQFDGHMYIDISSNGSSSNGNGSGSGTNGGRTGTGRGSRGGERKDAAGPGARQPPRNSSTRNGSPSATARSNGDAKQSEGKQTSPRKRKQTEAESVAETGSEVSTKPDQQQQQQSQQKKRKTEGKGAKSSPQPQKEQKATKATEAAAGPGPKAQSSPGSAASAWSASSSGASANPDPSQKSGQQQRQNPAKRQKTGEGKEAKAKPTQQQKPASGSVGKTAQRSPSAREEAESVQEEGGQGSDSEQEREEEWDSPRVSRVGLGSARPPATMTRGMGIREHRFTHDD